MSDLVRLTRTLHEAARGWGKIENDWGAEPRVTEIAYAQEVRSQGTEAYQTCFRIALPNLAMGGEREYTVTISSTDTRRR